MKTRLVVALAMIALVVGVGIGWLAQSRVTNRTLALMDHNANVQKIHDAAASVKMLRLMDDGDLEAAKRGLRTTLELSIDGLYRSSDGDLEFGMFASKYAGMVDECAAYLDTYDDRLGGWAHQLADRIDDEREAS